jgi:hypothetical protein
MKLTIWDVFAMVTLFAVVVVGIIFLQIFANPYSAVNPFPPPTMPAALALPTHTITPRSLPATWTPTPGGPVVQEPVSDPMTMAWYQPQHQYRHPPASHCQHLHRR